MFRLGPSPDLSGGSRGPDWQFWVDEAKKGPDAGFHFFCFNISLLT